MSIKISPSILAADFGNIERECSLIDKSDADWFHLDVMDGIFVPNISFGMPIVKAIRKMTSKPLDVHLMITQPERYIEKFRLMESPNHLDRICKMMSEQFNPNDVDIVLGAAIGGILLSSCVAKNIVK